MKLLINDVVLCILPVSHQLSWPVSVCTPPPKLLINSPYLCCWRHSYQKHVRLKDSILWTNGIPKECRNTGGLVTVVVALIRWAAVVSIRIIVLFHSHKTVSLFRRSEMKRDFQTSGDNFCTISAFPHNRAANSSICLNMQKQQWLPDWLIQGLIQSLGVWTLSRTVAPAFPILVSPSLLALLCLALGTKWSLTQMASTHSSADCPRDFHKFLMHFKF